MSYALYLCHSSIANDVCSDGYQDLHRADTEDIQLEVGEDMSGDLLGAGTSFQNGLRVSEDSSDLG